MEIKAVLFFIIILLGIILGNGEDPKGQRRKWYVIIIISLLILESSLRSISVGPDTKSYYYSYQNVGEDWGDLLNSFRIAYVEGEGKDPGYSVFMRIVKSVSPDFNFFLFVCALVFFVPLGFVLYRNSTHIAQLVFAFSLYVALFHIIALSGVRQQIATGFSFIALLQLMKNRNWVAVVIIIIGSLIHVSLLIFLLVPVIRIIIPQKVKALHLFSFALMPFAIIYAGDVMRLFASVLANEYYMGYSEAESSGSVFTYLFLMESLSMFCYIAIKKQSIVTNTKTGLLYTMLPLLTMTAPLISLDGALIRVGQYFTLYMMLLVPLAIDAMFKATNRRVMYFGFILILLVLSLESGGDNYYFFWQEPQI